MQIYPVLDLLDGVVVRGVAGRRKEYRPIKTPLARGSDALTIARAFRNRFGLTELYVADLDAIQQQQPNLQLYRALVDDGFTLMIDAGIRTLAQADEIFAAGVSAVIAGLETSCGPDQLRQLCSEFGASRIVFSLDLKAGQPLGNMQPWPSADPFEIAVTTIQVGIQRMIVLDLEQVGVGKGLSTVELCRRLLEHNPTVELITGGGVRGSDDLALLADSGVAGVLIASALHNGSIDRNEIERCSRL